MVACGAPSIRVRLKIGGRAPERMAKRRWRDDGAQRSGVSIMGASIQDVARLAGVSITTVSRVVNHSALVNEQTRARVEAAILRLNYRPNAFARGLMLRRSEIV